MGNSVAQYDFAVIGLGYVGLPLAVEATLTGELCGFGLDTSRVTVNGLNNGRSHVDDITSKEVTAASEGRVSSPPLTHRN